MPRFRLIVAACLVTFAVGAVASAAALAGEWDVNGKPITGVVALSNTAKVLQPAKLLIPAAGVTIECSGPELLIKGGKLIPPDILTVEDVTFHACIVISGLCKIPVLILTNPLHGLAELDGPSNTLVLILPATKNIIATIKFEGETCSLVGVQPIVTAGKDGIDLLIHGGIVSAPSHLVLVSSLEGKFKVGNDEAKLDGPVIDLALAGGENWNFL